MITKPQKQTAEEFIKDQTEKDKVRLKSFREDLRELEIKHGIVIVPTIKYTDKGIFASLSHTVSDSDKVREYYSKFDKDIQKNEVKETKEEVKKA